MFDDDDDEKQSILKLKWFSKFIQLIITIEFMIKSSDGTTDVTRTLHFGQPTQEQREAYTNVLIGQIELTTATFPSTIRTDQLDVLARKALWKRGSDYRHGTSHGIGHFLSAHECEFNKLISVFWKSKVLEKFWYNFFFKAPIAGNEKEVPGCNSMYMRPGYFLSNEPGFYKEGDFGVRLENIIEVIQADLPVSLEENKVSSFHIQYIKNNFFFSEIMGSKLFDIPGCNPRSVWTKADWSWNVKSRARK